MSKQYKVKFYTANGNEIEVLLDKEEFEELEFLKYSLSGVFFRDKVMIKGVVAYYVVDIYESPEEEDAR